MSGEEHTLAVDLLNHLPTFMNAIMLLSGGIMMVAMVRTKLELLIQRLTSVEGEFQEFAKDARDNLAKITDILVEQAKHDQRLIAIERDIRTLKAVMMMNNGAAKKGKPDAVAEL